MSAMAYGITFNRHVCRECAVPKRTLFIRRGTLWHCSTCRHLKKLVKYPNRPKVWETVWEISF